MNIEDKIYPFLKFYMKSPQWLKNLVGFTYSMIPVSLRYGNSYNLFNSQLNNKDSINKIALNKLMDTLDWAKMTVPYYKCINIDKSNDPLAYLYSFPIISKDEIKHNLQDFLSDEMPLSRRLEAFTGGSTANPMRFFLEKSVTRSKEFAYIEDFDRRAGISSHDIILALRGRTVPGAGKPGRELWMYEPIKRHLILSSDHLEPQYMPDYVQALRHWKPTIIQAFPSAIYPLAKWLKKHPEPEITRRIKCIQLTSENIYDFQLEILRDVFNCPILEHYGHSERVLMACTLPEDDRYFFWPLYGYPEIVDANGKPITQPGEIGELVGTSFDNKVMPFVRYRTGDLAMWSDQPHPNYPGWPVVEKIFGRLQEFVVCNDRRIISICTLGAAHLSELADVDEIQYEQKVIGNVILKIQSKISLSAQQKEKVKKAFWDKTQGGCTVDIIEVKSIERTSRGKLQMLKQHLDLKDYFGAVSDLRNL